MAHPDLDELLNALLPFAQEILAKHSEFHPCGARMTPAGAIELLGANTGSEHPSASDLIAVMTDALRVSAGAGEIRAGALCFDVRLRQPIGDATDAVCVSLDHATADAVDVYLPYQVGSSRETEYGELSAARGSLSLFDSTP